MNHLYLAALSLAIMAVFIYFEKKEKYVLAVIFKGLASLCFVVLGVYSAKGGTDFSQKVTIGLMLGMAADILLNLRMVFKKVGKIIFLVGILVFLSGHVMYILALLPECKNLLVPLIIGAILTALILVWIFKQITAQMAFKIFGVFYIGAITIMNCIAVANLLSNPCGRNVMFVIGAILFLLSDIVLILNTFGKESKFSLRVTNLSLYYMGQILIALSMQLL